MGSVLTRGEFSSHLIHSVRLTFAQVSECVKLAGLPEDGLQVAEYKIMES